MAMDQSAVEAKKCRKCGEVKGLGEFGRHIARKDGLDTRCKQCNRDAVNAYRAANIESARAADRERVAAMTPEQKRDRGKLWADANREHVRAYSRDGARRRYKEDPSKYLNKTRQRTIQLTDSYVSAAIGCRVSEVPPALIALKREQLAIKRMARELKKAATQQDGATP